MPTVFRLLFRRFLFAVVDREVLSTHANGDSSQFLLQLVALLVGLGILLCLPAAIVTGSGPVTVRLETAWSLEHFLIATTMLMVAVFGVLSWNTMFPGPSDVYVLSPLPIRRRTIVLAKLSALLSAFALAIVALHATTGIVWPLALGRVALDGPLRAPAARLDAAAPPASARTLEEVLRRDLAEALHSGRLAAGAGGGLAVGIIQRGERRLFGLGAASPDSLFQIGSVTKPMTGLLLAALVEEGLASLDEPVRQLLPRLSFPAPRGPEITLIDLATHRAGIPGMPPYFRPADPANPAADFDVAELYTYMSQRGLAKPERPGFRYSNLGFGLLGHALSARAGMTYGALLDRTVIAPLGMADTVLTPRPEQRPRLMQGYADDGQALPPWDFDVLAPAGGVRSTARDLLTWLDANLHPAQVQSPTLASAIRLSQTARARLDRERFLGLGWMIHPASGEIEHGGTLLGFSADLFFRPAADLAVVVLSNAGPGTTTSAEVVGQHIRARLDGQPAVSLTTVTVPRTGGPRAWLRLLAAYWVTMLAAGLFVLGVVVCVHGLVAAVLPRRTFLRLSTWLQASLFCVAIAGYFLQPTRVTPELAVAANSGGFFASSPSLWFLGLFQHVSGSPALATLARQAWIALATAVGGGVLAYGLCYERTMRKIAEQPDGGGSTRRFPWRMWGAQPRAAIVQFAARTLVRSAPHRLILAFYWGIGLACTLILLKAPRGQQLADVAAEAGWEDTAAVLIVATFVTTIFAIMAARVAFAMPRDLHANWLFRVTPAQPCRSYASARRWALVLVSAAPVWLGWAVVLAVRWPWLTAATHLAIVAVFGAVCVELALMGPPKVSCACSYLPGKSHVHLAATILALVILPLTITAAEYELEALHSTRRVAIILGTLAALAVALRWRSAMSQESGPRLEEEPANQAVTLDLWDARASSTTAP